MPALRAVIHPSSTQHFVLQTPSLVKRYVMLLFPRQLVATTDELWSQMLSRRLVTGRLPQAAFRYTYPRAFSQVRPLQAEAQLDDPLQVQLCQLGTVCQSWLTWAHRMGIIPTPRG